MRREIDAKRDGGSRTRIGHRVDRSTVVAEGGRDQRESDLRAAVLAAQAAIAARDAKVHQLERDLEEARGIQAKADREIRELCVLIQEQRERLEQAAARADALVGQESGLRAMLLEAHEELLQRDEEFAAALQRAELGAPRPASPPDKGAGSGTFVHKPAVGNRAETVAARYIEYRTAIQQIREITRNVLPPKVRVLVVSKGDDDLLELGGAQGWHFPQTGNGTYAGHHPADSTSAIEHLEALRARGAKYLLLPSTAFWWLDHYAAFERHLRAQYRRVFSDERCLIYELSRSRLKEAFPPTRQAVVRARNGRSAARQGR